MNHLKCLNRVLVNMSDIFPHCVVTCGLIFSSRLDLKASADLLFMDICDKKFQNLGHVTILNSILRLREKSHKWL